MEKGIDLQVKLHVGTDPSTLSAVRRTLPDLFARANPGLTLSIKRTSAAGSGGDATLRVFITGDQDPAADFGALTRGALHKAIAAYNSGADRAHQPEVHIKSVKEMEGDEDDEDSGVTLAPHASPATASMSAASPPAAPSTATGEAATPQLVTPPSPAPAPASPPAAAPPSTSAQPSAGRRQWWAFWRRGN
jgi:hypothetical protein